MRAFLAISTQWRTAALPNGRLAFMGLDYAGVSAGLDRAGMRMTPDLWSDVQLIEAGAMAALNRADR